MQSSVWCRKEYPKKERDAVYAVARDPRLDFKSSRLRNRRSLETNRHGRPSRVMLESDATEV
jgi:hypothetical protein